MKDVQLRKHLTDQFNGGQAFETFDDAIKEFSVSERGKIPKGAEHSAWQIVDHLLRALIDIIEYSENDNGKYVEMNWPDDYWAKERLGDWNKTVRGYRKAKKRMIALINDPKQDLFRKFPWAKDHTLLREAMIAADHEAYHVGQLTELKRWLTKPSPKR